MANNINIVVLEGGLVKDPEIKYTPGGTAICTLNMGSSRSYKQGDEWKTEKTYIKVEVWGKMAESCADLKKASQLIITGRLKTKSWENKEGKTISELVLVAESIKFIATPGAKKEEMAKDNESSQGDLPF